MYTYTQANLQQAIVDSKKYPNIASQITIQDVLNRTARMLWADFDPRGSRRSALLASKLFDDQYEYAAPTDLKNDAIIDLFPQANRIGNSALKMVTSEEFDRKKTVYNNLINVYDSNTVKKIRASFDVIDEVIKPCTFDTLTQDGGTWTAYSDATNVVVDDVNYIGGSGSIKFDLTGSATTAGIYNTDVDEFDISAYTNDGSAFVWVYINSTTNLTNWILNVGQDLTTNYYAMTATTQADGTAFTNGWNLLRFDFSGATENGTVTDSAVNSIRIYMTKTSGKSDDGYRIDSLSFHSGEMYTILYYSKYPWQTSGGSFIENSTTTTDKINLDTDEFDLLVFLGKREVAKELRDWETFKVCDTEYKERLAGYKLSNPTQKVNRTSRYW